MVSNFNSLVQLFDSTYRTDKYIDLLNHHNIEFTGLHGSGKSIFIVSLFKNADKGIVVITRNNRDAHNLYTDLQVFLENKYLYHFPSSETLPYNEGRQDIENIYRRLVGLNALVQKKTGVFVVPVRAVMDFYLPRDIFVKNLLKIKTGDSVSLVEMGRKLSLLGYERADRVSSPGMFSVRGDILDVFVPGSEHPCRVEFFDDAVESLRTFSVMTQRSVGEKQELEVIPASEIILSPEADEYLREAKHDQNREVIENIRSGDCQQGTSDYVSLMYAKPSTFNDYAGNGYIYLIDSLGNCRRQADFYQKETVRLYSEKRYKQFVLPPEQVITDFNSQLNSLYPRANISSFPEWDCERVDFGLKDKKGYRGQIKTFKKDLERLLEDGYTVIVGASYEGQTNRVRELLKDQTQRFDNLVVATLDLHEGFVAPGMKVAVILDREIFNRKKRHRTKFLKTPSKPIGELLDIKEGDYIVHVDHGIGIYRGIERLNTGGTEKDFFKIEYRDGDEIFVPVDQINLLQKYIGQEGRTPRIDKIGSATWKKVKAHVKKSVKNLAKELLELYSVRANMKGRSFSRDTEWQFEFESSFRYEETPDQVRAVQEIKDDMEAEKPMDRLVCGDVGFGKTEVAIRACFKAVMNGAQVAMLVPTTVLAEQHLNTFRDRFSQYPINVEMLSRFKTPAEQKTIINNLKAGSIDVVVGTHRLIQDDVQFKNLGMVIIDEEQRFGVEHKEKLKQLRKMVDVITLTATPIPRTLYMAMTKLRDMSVIETPPRERIPIETYVTGYNEDIIAKAICKEVQRGGQVYYVHNRVKTIDRRADQLRRIMPDVTFEVAHGQMEENQLEDIMKAFYDMEFQVLVTTTIIESGLDIPNVNTIIIERADKFGLAQLYQLRGRVGRSRRKAYAYLLYPTDKMLTEQAQKRLSVINEHTELGAGFSIALKDLEIRGAGNILGREQHGEMLAVGYEMYVKLLDEAIAELKNEHVEKKIDPVIDVKYSGYIPKQYIPSEKLRIEFYKKLAGVRKKGELEEIREELADRFGPLPVEMHELLTVVELKNICRDVGIKQLKEMENELQLIFEKSRVDIITLIKKINQNRRIFQISPSDYSTLHVYKIFQGNRQKLEFLKELFDYNEPA
ncbi:MAG: transcription-repair coupling factor [Spirochaetota bacterium]